MMEPCEPLHAMQFSLVSQLQSASWGADRRNGIPKVINAHELILGACSKADTLEALQKLSFIRPSLDREFHIISLQNLILDPDNLG